MAFKSKMVLHITMKDIQDRTAEKNILTQIMTVHKYGRMVAP